MVMFPYSDAVIRCLAWLLLYWSGNVNSYPKGCWTVIQLCKWNESFLAWFSFTVNPSLFKCQKWCRNTALLSPGYLHISFAVREQLSWCGGYYFDKAISKDRIQNKNILVSPINVKYMVSCQTLLGHTSENLFSFKWHYILFSEECLVPVWNSLE